MNIKKILFKTVRSPLLLVPKYVRDRCDTERLTIDDFVINFIFKNIKKEDKILDAGAGPLRYIKYFKGYNLETCDFEDIFDKDSLNKHTFLCSLESIPKSENSYDVVINTQVLEHIEHPAKSINEFYRILKPGGKLFLTTNQMFPVHHAPYNFFFFTNFGLQSMFKEAGFEIVSIKPRGGIFYLLAKMFDSIVAYIFYQMFFSHYKKTPKDLPRLKHPILYTIFLPIQVILELIFQNILPFIFFYMDKLDRQKDFTLGYSCYVVKPKK